MERPTTPERPIIVREHKSTTHKNFFYHYDVVRTNETHKEICDKVGIHRNTGYNWLRKRRELGSPARHHTRKLSNRLGPASKVTKKTVELLLSPSRNPARDQAYEAQMEFHHIPLTTTRQLRKRIQAEAPGAKRFKQAYSKTSFSKKNVDARRKHGQTYSGKSIEDTFQFWVCSDEAHLDPSAQQAGFILRKPGTRLEPENIQMRGNKTGVVFHIAGWCNWWALAPELMFYHDEEEKTEQPKRPRKPRRSKKDTDEEWEKKLALWQESLPHPVEVKPKGNSMTGAYYTQRILPGLITAVQNLRTRFQIKGIEEHFILLEDNDRSHGHTLPHKPDTIQDKTKKEAGVQIIEHPAKSPDVNPQEAVWNILKARVKKRVWGTNEEYKAIVQEEYSKITLEEVRARILEMPWRLEQLRDYPDKIIKSDLW